MKIVIKDADNGFTMEVDHNDGEFPSRFAYQEQNCMTHEPNTVAHVADLLRDLVELLGQAGSRHDKYRISISIQPGDKYIDAAEQE